MVYAHASMTTLTAVTLCNIYLWQVVSENVKCELIN